MKKKLEFEPIYKGEIGMTPDRSEEIMRASEYVQNCKKNRKQNFIIGLVTVLSAAVTTIVTFAMLVALFI